MEKYLFLLFTVIFCVFLWVSPQHLHWCECWILMTGNTCCNLKHFIFQDNRFVSTTSIHYIHFQVKFTKTVSDICRFSKSYLSSWSYQWRNTTFFLQWLGSELCFHTLEMKINWYFGEEGGEIGGRRVYVPSAPVKHLADLRNRANSQRYSSMYEDRRLNIVEDIERSEGKKSVKGQ